MGSTTLTRRDEWVGDTPMRCDLCKKSIVNEFVDGKLHNGPWAIMCTDCHCENGVGLGLGRGQKFYRLGEGDTFIKIDG